MLASFRNNETFVLGVDVCSNLRIPKPIIEKLGNPENIKFVVIDDKTVQLISGSSHVFRSEMVKSKKQADPLSYRSKRKQQQNDPFAFRAVAHNGTDPHSNQNLIHHREDKPKSSQDISDQRLFKPKAFAEHSDGLTSKLEEIRRRAKSYIDPHLVDDKLSDLSLLVMSGSASEAFVDELLEKTRYMVNMMEALSWFLTSKPSLSNTPITEEALLHSHRFNLRLRQLSEATRFKLAEINRVLKSYCHESDSHESDIWEKIEDLIKRCDMTGGQPFS